MIQEDIIRRIKDRKTRVLDNIRNVFREVLVKERELNDGELNLSQVLYSAEIAATSSERLADEEELKQDKLKLIRHLQNKLHLKLDLSVKSVPSEPSADSSSRKFD